MAPPQPRKGPTRVPQNPLMGGFLGSQMPPQVGSFSPPVQPPPIGSPLTGAAGNFYQYPQLTQSPLSIGSRGQALAGLTQQNRGMAELTGQIQGLTRQSQIQNPLVPSSPTAGVPSPLNPFAQAQMDFMQRQDAARQQNLRYGDFSQPVGQAYSNGISLRPEDMRARLTSRDAGLQLGGAQMLGRFAPESPLGQQAADYQRGLAGVAGGEGVFIQPGGRGSDQQYLQFNNTPEGAAALAAEQSRLRREDRTASGFRSQEQRAAQLKEGLDRRNAAITAGLPKQRAEAKKASLQDRSLKRAVARGLNPLSPQAQALYPEAAGRLRAARAAGIGQQAPASPLNPLNTFANGPGGTVTAQDRANAQTGQVGLVHGIPGPPDKDGNPTPGPAGNPFLQQMGAVRDPANPEKDIGEVHAGMLANLGSANPVTPTGTDLRALKDYADTLKAQHGGSAFKIGYGTGRETESSYWKKLADMPSNVEETKLADWFKEYSSFFSPVAKASAGQGTPSPLAPTDFYAPRRF